MVEHEILSALQKAVTAAVLASDDADFPVSYVGVDFTPPNDKKYLELVYIPNNAAGDFLGDEKNYQGIMRLVMHWPNDGGGAYAALRLLGSICEYFTKGRLLAGVQVVEPPNLTGAIADGDEMLYPASLRYMSYRSA